MEKLITKDMTIGDVIQKYPSSIEVLLAAGVHCVGCHVSYFETLEEGFKGHGMSDEEINTVITELNNAVKDDAASGEIISLTKKAADKLKEILQAEGKPNSGLRVDITPGGCEGNSYALELADAQGNDEAFEMHGVKVFVSKENIELVKGSKIDYVDALQDGGFRISNPNKQHCGCGKSFS
ncbi:iron-sulfur cluster assembly accessory protein [Candidatus Woesearchaeota archaeon]|nr:iron-sulfur cluster assembly accessory protein [Candidatus Woesearchaeota archaeon]